MPWGVLGFRILPRRLVILPKNLFLDNHLIAVYKPAGILTQADSSESKSLIDEVKSWIKTEFNNRHVSAGGKFDKFRTLFLISQSNTLAREVLMHGKNTLAVLPKEVVKKELKGGHLKELQLQLPVFSGLVDVFAVVIV